MAGTSGESPTDGGFVLNGAWSFGSGLWHATHIHTLGIIEVEDGATATPTLDGTPGTPGATPGIGQQQHAALRRTGDEAGRAHDQAPEVLCGRDDVRPHGELHALREHLADLHEGHGGVVVLPRVVDVADRVGLHVHRADGQGLLMVLDGLLHLA